MDIETLRDFVIVIGGFLLIFTLILAAILGFIFFRQIKGLTKSVKGTINTAKEMGTEVKQAVRSFKDIPNIFKSSEPKREDKTTLNSKV